MARRVDDKDLKLLRALKKNARASLVSLSRDIGLSRSATHDRIARLEADGVIKGYTVRIDPDATPSTHAFLTITFETGAAQAALADAVCDKDGVDAAYCLAGDIDMLVVCACDSADALNALREDIARFPGVVDIVTRHVLSYKVG